MSDADTIIVNHPAGRRPAAKRPAGPLGLGPRFDQAASELLISVGLVGEKSTLGTAYATKVYAASDAVVTPPASDVST